MKRTRITVHLSTIRRCFKDKVYECHLPRRTFREGKKARHETVANLLALPPVVNDVIRMALSGRKMVPVDEAFEPLKSLPTGHVRAVRAVWKFGVPPVRNGNFAWVQHIIHHLSPTGYAGFVLANGSMSSNQSGEGEVRKNLVEGDVVNCRVALRKLAATEAGER